MKGFTLDPEMIARAIAAQVVEQRAAAIEELSLVSVAQAAEMLGVSTPTARKLLRRGVDAGGRALRVRLSDVRELINSRTVRMD